MVQQVSQDLAYKAIQCQDQWVHLHRDPWVHQVQQDHQVLQDHRVHQVHWVHRVLLV